MMLAKQHSIIWQADGFMGTAAVLHKPARFAKLQCALWLTLHAVFAPPASPQMHTCYVQNIAEWEMTDDDIEVAIKLADKSGDGRIDYDEFIAFVFGEDEPAQRLQTNTNQVLPEQQPLEMQAAPFQAAAAGADMLPSAATGAPEKPAETLTVSSNSWPATQETPPADQLPEVQLPTSGLDSMQAAVLSARQQSLTDAWVAAQAADITPANPAEATLQAGIVYDNALYQDDAPSAPHAGAAHHVPLWEVGVPTASSDLPTPGQQPGDDVRLDIQTDQAMLDHMQPPAEAQFQSQWSQQAAHRAASFGEDDLGALEQASADASCDTQWPQCLQEDSDTLQPPPADRGPAASAGSGRSVTARAKPIEGQGSEPGGLQAFVHGDAVHLHMPLEAHDHAVGFPGASQPDATPLHPAPQSGLQPHATKPSVGTKTPLKAPRKLPALSYVQLSQGVNRSQVKQQHSHRQS